MEFPADKRHAAGGSLAACGRFYEQSSAQENTGASSRSSLLDKVLNRKKLACGVSGELPGFSYVDQQEILRPRRRCVPGDRRCPFDDPEAVDFNQC